MRARENIPSHQKFLGMCCNGWCTNHALEQIGLCQDCMQRLKRLVKDGKAQRSIVDFGLLRKPYIYFMKRDGMVKIGSSAKPRSRLSQIKSSGPTKVDLLFCMKYGGSDLENWFHRFLSEHREQGEWFRIEGKVEVIIAQINEGMKPGIIPEIYLFNLDRACGQINNLADWT